MRRDAANEDIIIDQTPKQSSGQSWWNSCLLNKYRLHFSFFFKLESFRLLLSLDMGPKRCELSYFDTVPAADEFSENLNLPCQARQILLHHLNEALVTDPVPAAF